MPSRATLALADARWRVRQDAPGTVQLLRPLLGATDVAEPALALFVEVAQHPEYGQGAGAALEAQLRDDVESAQSGEIWEVLATIRRDAGDLEGALQAQTEVVSLSPTPARRHQWLIDLEDAERWPALVHALVDELVSCEDDVELRMRIARLRLYKLDDHGGALQILQPVIQSLDARDDLEFVLRVQERAGEPVQAAASLERLAAMLGPVDGAKKHQRRATLLEGVGELEAAMSACVTAVELAPELIEPAESLVRLAMLNSDWEVVARALTQVIRLSQSPADKAARLLELARNLRE